MERELNSKSSVLGGFEKTKKFELTKLNDKVKDLTVALRNREMEVEDALGSL